MDLLTNRELAIIIWTAIVFIVLLFKRDIRIPLIRFIKSAFQPAILTYFLFFLAYFSLFVYTLYHFEWWDISNLKDAIIWFIFSGLPIGFVVATTKIENNFWRNLVLKNLKVTVFAEVIITTFVFSLIIELILVPVVTFLVMLNTIWGLNKEKKDGLKVVNPILSILGLFILSYSLHQAIGDYIVNGNVSVLESFLFLMVYSIISIPYMYIFALYVEYDKLFTRLKLKDERDSDLDFWIKVRLLIFCNFRMKRLQIAADMKNYNIMSISSKDGIDAMIQSYKDALAKRRHVKANSRI